MAVAKERLDLMNIRKDLHTESVPND